MGTDETTYAALADDGITTTGDVVRVEFVSGKFAKVDAPTERSRRIWSAGEYDKISAGFRHEALDKRLRLGVKPGMDVLDAACGSGNLTLPAAKTGARVVGLDLIQSLLDAAGAWATRERVAVRLDQGNVEALPYPDAQFDVVMSMFGVMFAARPDRVMAEMARVTRSGGRVALANWTREGFVGRMLALHVAYAPPPAGTPSPLWWGSESIMEEWFDRRLWTVSCVKRTLRFRYEGSPTQTAELFASSYGPTVRAMETLTSDRRAAFVADLTALWIGEQKGSADGTQVDSDYLEVLAVRR